MLGHWQFPCVQGYPERLVETKNLRISVFGTRIHHKILLVLILSRQTTFANEQKIAISTHCNAMKHAPEGLLIDRLLQRVRNPMSWNHMMRQD